ncbi:hypothetical protein HK096_007515, partial [Nowakowskiella sp. JEL0078]
NSLSFVQVTIPPQLFFADPLRYPSLIPISNPANQKHNNRALVSTQSSKLSVTKEALEKYKCDEFRTRLHSAGLPFSGPKPVLVSRLCDHYSGFYLTNITVRFLPAGTTSVLQPLDAGIIHSLKARYRKSFVKWWLNCIEKDVDVNTPTLLEAVKMLAEVGSQLDPKFLNLVSDIQKFLQKSSEVSARRKLSGTCGSRFSNDAFKIFDR